MGIRSGLLTHFMGDAHRQNIRLHNVNAHVDRAAADLTVLDVTLR